MPIVLSSISGGIVDDYDGQDGIDSSKTFPNAGIEKESYQDLALVTPEPGFVSVISTTVSVLSTVDVQVQESELTTSNNLNFSFSNSPSLSPFGTLSITTTPNSATFNGTVEEEFNDIYWEVKDLEKNENKKSETRSTTTSGDEGLYFLKPSLVRYTYRIYRVTSIHIRSNGTTSTFTYDIIKRILNLWEENRLLTLSILNQQEIYKQNNYPR